MNEKCKLCEEPIPIKILYRLNRIAVQNGYCSWICCSMDLGEKKSEALLNKDGAIEQRKSG